MLLAVLLVISVLIDPVYGEDVSDYDTGIDLIRCYRESGEVQKAEDLLEVMLRGPRDDRKVLRNDAFIDAIRCYLREGQLQKAENLLKAAPQQHPEDISLTYDTGIEAVKESVKEGDFLKAERIVKKLSEQYPDNIELLTVSARLLFWQKRYDESLEEYERIVRLHDDETVRREMAKVEVARIISRADILIGKGENRQAEAILMPLFESKREQYDSGYRLGMLYIKEREYDEAKEIFRTLKTLFPEDRGFAALYVESLILNGEIRKAEDELNALPEDVKTQLSRERDDLFYRVKRNFARVTGTFLNYSGNYKNERDVTLEISQRIREMTFVIAASSVHRFGLHDDQITLDVYSLLGEKTKRWGYLSFSVSPDPEFLAKTVFGGEIYQGYKGTEISLGYRRMNFKLTSVDILLPGVVFYLPSGFSLAEKLYLVPNNHSFAVVSTLHYEPSHRFWGSYSFSVGNSAETIRSATDVVKVPTFSNRLRTEYRFAPSLSMGAEVSYEYRRNLYSDYGATLFSRYWW